MTSIVCLSAARVTAGSGAATIVADLHLTELGLTLKGVQFITGAEPQPAQIVPPPAIEFASVWHRTAFHAAAMYALEQWAAREKVIQDAIAAAIPTPPGAAIN